MKSPLASADSCIALADRVGVVMADDAEVIRREAPTELCQQVRNEKTPVMVGRVVADIDAIVRLVRFPGWQQASAGEREVKKALRKSLLKYQLLQDVELFEKACGDVVQYY